MRIFVFLGFLGLLLSVSASNSFAAEAARQEDEKLATFFRSYLDLMFRDEPLSATRLGDHRFDDQLDDVSEEGRKKRVDRDRQVLEDLTRQVEHKSLSRNAQIDYEIFKHHLSRSIWQAENFKPFEDDPRVYGEYATESVYLLFTQSTLPKATNLKNALARMEKIPAILKIAKATIHDPAKVKTETAVRQTEGGIHFYKEEIYTLSGEPKGKGELAAKANAVAEALTDFLKFLKEDVLPKSGDSWRIGLAADEVLDEALREADRVEREMAVIARQLWGTTFPGQVIPPDDADGRRLLVKKILDHVAQNHGTPDSLVNDARATVDSIKGFITKNEILHLPEPDQCRVIEMPEFMRGNSVAYLNPAPPLDQRGSSEYAISPPPSDWSPARVMSMLQEYNHAMLKILTIHEAYPGHYVQLEYSNRNPSLIRKILSSGTFAEGWAVYTEQMMIDQGFGEGDLGLRLQQLKFYLRAVVNAILDHEMHAGTMTDKEAMELLAGRAFQTEGEAVGKIIRAKQSSAQLSTYFVGRTAFYRLRQKIQRQLGDKFHLGRYHEAVLSHGTLPVKYLPELVGKDLESAK